MKLIDPNVVQIVESNPYKKIERIGRICYKSEDRITDSSYENFLKVLFRNKHLAMIEHASQVFEISAESRSQLHSYLFTIAVNSGSDFYDMNNRYLSVTTTYRSGKLRVLVSGNIRAILQRELNDPIYRSLVEAYPLFETCSLPTSDPLFTDVEAKCVNIEDIPDLTYEEFLNHVYCSFKFTTDRGVTHELVRHRPFSFAQESTRYCNYSNGKYGSELTFIRPSTYESWSAEHKDKFIDYLKRCEVTYMNMVNVDPKLQPQQARAVLPNCLKTEIVVTGNMKEWQHFVNLRSRGVTGAPHPDMKLVADNCFELLSSYVASFNYTI